MVQVPIVGGIYADGNGEFRTSYPLNLVPIPKAQGISEGYLRPADGIVPLGSGPGVCRGSIVWNGVLYAVMGSDLVTVLPNGNTALAGTIGGTGRVTMVYSFDALAIASDGQLWIYQGGTLTQNTDPDLGTVIDVVWVDGYFMATDGTSLVVTDLTSPLSVNPLRYGSSEIDPDPIVGLVKVRNEVYAINRNTIEIFDNIGGEGFPFSRIDGAQIQKGAISAQLATAFGPAVAFVGGGSDEPPSVWLGANGSELKLATREIDTILQGYTDAQLATAWVDVRTDRVSQFLYLHLPDKTLAYDAAASAALGSPVWFILSSGGKWRVASFAWCYGKWVVFDTDTAATGVFSDAVSSHWGISVDWEFSTPIIFNNSQRAIIHSIELIALPGRAAFGDDPQIGTQWTSDGETWSQPRYVKAGKQGERNKRLMWLQQGPINLWRAQRFFGTSDAHLSVARLEAAIEPMVF